MAKTKHSKCTSLDGLISTSEAAKRYGYTQDHLGHLLRKGTLIGCIMGRDWFINEASLEKYVESDPRPGRSAC
jgi:excisionase family DNA binding protein